MIIKLNQGYQVINSYSGKPMSEIYPDKETAENHNKAYLAKVRESYNQSVLKVFNQRSEAAKDTSNGIAQYRLGLCYYEGKGVTKDLNKAAELFKAAAEMGVLDAQYYMGLYYNAYRWPEYDIRKAFKMFMTAAESGHPAAQCKMAQFYHYGNYTLQITTNYEEEARWYQMAAENGYAEAQYKIGLCYAYGKGTIKDVNKALEWLVKASKQGHYHAVDAIVELCEREDIQLDAKLVFEGYKLAATKGDLRVAYNLAECYNDGFGIDRDYDESVKWKMIAAQRGHQYACLDLGLKYMDGDIVEQDYSESMRYLKKISDCWPEAMFWIGIHHFDGLGTPQDFKLAHQWFQKASDSGYPPAQYQLGLCYESGQGVEASDKYALEYFFRAANRGHGEAQYRVGLYYANGIGAIQDHQNAYFWLYIASKYECEEARSGLRSVARHLTTAQKERIRAAANKWMKDLENEELIY